MVHVDNKGILDGLLRAEMKCIGPTAKDADLWILISEELNRVPKEGILVEVEHVKAHRCKKEKQQMSPSDIFITEGNEKADELAKEGAVMDGGVTAQIRANTVQHTYAASFRCLVEEWKECKELKLKSKEVDFCGQEREKQSSIEWSVRRQAKEAAAQ